MNIAEPTAEDREAWKAWVDARPASVRNLIVSRAFEPWKLYRLKSSGHRVTIWSFDEEHDGRITLRVDVSGEFNLVVMERRVFGIKPEDLEECDLPDPNEPLGSFDVGIEEVRKIIRDPLFGADIEKVRDILRGGEFGLRGDERGKKDGDASS